MRHSRKQLGYTFEMSETSGNMNEKGSVDLE